MYVDIVSSLERMSDHAVKIAKPVLVHVMSFSPTVLQELEWAMLH